MTDHTRKAAWLQAALLVAALAVVAAVLFARLQRPFDRDTLVIQVEQLQSQSAEAALLARNAVSDRLAPGFTRQHVRQLADAVDRVDETLQSKSAQSELLMALIAARHTAATLHGTLVSWSNGATQATQAIPEFDQIALRLDALDSELKPEDVSG